MTNERVFKWTTRFLIWTVAAILFTSIFDIYDRWAIRYPKAPYDNSAENVGAFIGFATGVLARFYWMWVLLLIVTLVLRYQRSRIAAGLLAFAGLWGLGLSIVILWHDLSNALGIGLFVFFGLYLASAIWSLLVLQRMRNKPSTVAV